MECQNYSDLAVRNLSRFMKGVRSPDKENDPLDGMISFSTALNLALYLEKIGDTEYKAAGKRALAALREAYPDAYDKSIDAARAEIRKQVAQANLLRNNA